MYRILAQKFPNNEIRLTWASLPSPRDPFAPDSDGVVPEDMLSSEDVVKSELVSQEEKIDSPLSLGPNSKTERSSTGYGELPARPTVFGLNAKRTLVRSGGALESVAPPEETLFLTGTLPGSTTDAFKAIASYSSYIVNSLKAWIANYVPQKLDFYCWEYQKRGALHLHYAIHCPDGDARTHILNGFHGWWVGILHRIGEKTRTDLFRRDAGKTWLDDTSKVRAVAEVCRKSVARYLAKYLSKSISPKRGNGRFFTPARWWGVSRPLKALTDSLTSTVCVIESGYQAVRRKWEELAHDCTSSESVTYSYPHQVGEGRSMVSYPTSPTEGNELWLTVVSRSVMMMERLTGQSPLPSVALKVVKMKQIQYLEDALERLSPSFQGLSNSLERELAWIRAFTPSTSPAPLSLLLAWMAHLSDILSISQFTPILTRQKEREIRGWMDEIESYLPDINENGWR